MAMLCCLFVLYQVRLFYGWKSVHALVNFVLRIAYPLVQSSCDQNLLCDARQGQETCTAHVLLISLMR